MYTYVEEFVSKIDFSESSSSAEKKKFGINFDISKAFYNVWHALLIFKLLNLGVPSYIIRFIKDFLTDRTLKVKNKYSTSKTVLGTPRISFWTYRCSSILFIVFINDILLANSNNISYSALFQKVLTHKKYH